MAVLALVNLEEKEMRYMLKMRPLIGTVPHAQEEALPDGNRHASLQQTDVYCTGLDLRETRAGRSVKRGPPRVAGRIGEGPAPLTVPRDDLVCG